MDCSLRSCTSRFLLLTVCAIIAGGSVGAVPYDYSATLEAGSQLLCLKEPLKPQYGGGIILNPELEDGLHGWSKFAGGEIQLRASERGNKFVVSHSRNQSYHSVSQKLYLHNTMLYTLSAWVQVSKLEAPVVAVLKTISGYRHAGRIQAKSGCWSMLKGGLTPNISGPAELYFESPDANIDIWVDSISLQPFTPQEWENHRVLNMEKVRKKRVQIQVVDKNGMALSGAEVLLRQLNAGLPVGCAINNNILNNAAYQGWFNNRFKLTTFENEMKWYSNEGTRGKEDYSTADALMGFAKQNGVSVRGHNVLWNDPRYQPQWLTLLPTDQITEAANKRVNSIMNKYKGQVIAWDVVNENLHYSFFETKLGDSASASFYGQASKIDPGTTLFMNDYNTLEEPSDLSSTPDKYVAKMKAMAAAANPAKMAIGLEGHFQKTPDLAYVRSTLDTLSSSGFPIWLTELDMSKNVPDQAKSLGDVLTEAHGHQGVQGIVIWGAWSPQGCYRMCLTDNNFKNLPTGDAVDKFLATLKSSPSDLFGATDSNGIFHANLFHGDYEITVSHPTAGTSLQGWKVSNEKGDDEARMIKFVL